ncbi:MAG: DUF502 domain-containing protein [Fusobacteria bacterium]|nr:DUF502 domain-containing protein [Fusobacteriota bacterium]
MKKMSGYFITGILSITPISLTIFILFKIADFTVNIFTRFFSINKIMNFVIKSLYVEDKFFAQIIVGIIVYSVAILILYFFIVFMGLLIAKLINKEKIKYFEKIFLKIPLAKPIYSTLKQIRDLVLVQNGSSFKKVVLAEYPRKGIYSLGFLTSEKNNFTKKISDNDEYLNIFIPTSPNPTSGMFIIINKKDVIEVDMKIEDAIKLIISGGAITPEEIK